MLVLERDGSLVAETISICVTSERRGVVELSADVVLQQDHMIDRVIELMFTVLGLSSVEVRVYEEGIE